MGRKRGLDARRARKRASRLGCVALVYYPGRVGPAAMFVALLAAAMGGFQSRFAAWALVAVTASWFLGMVLAVIFERPIF